MGNIDSEFPKNSLSVSLRFSKNSLCDKGIFTCTLLRQFLIKPFDKKFKIRKCFCILSGRERHCKVMEAVKMNGSGKVLVIDARGSFSRAVVGDFLAEKAVKNMWAGIVVYGCIRDSKIINSFNIGIKALGTHPRKTEKKQRKARPAGRGKREAHFFRWCNGCYGVILWSYI